MSERESWGNHCEFFLSSLGLAVGLGNVWRFPYVCLDNGGGSFLIPYVLMLFLVGFPGLYVEQNLGQYGRAGANKVFGRMVPIFKSLGYAMISVRFLLNIYYVIICAWTFFYLFAGFTSHLPWGTCTEEWNTKDCYTLEYANACNDSGLTFFNFNCSTKETYCTYHKYDGWLENNDTCFDATGTYPFQEVLQNNSISPAEDYFNGYVLGLTKDKDGNQHDWSDYGTISWQLALCLLLAWILVCLIVIKGVSSLGKASYVITLSPYFVLTALMIYAVFLPGFADGIKFFLTPDWGRLLTIQVWAKAASQILFSLSVGFGSQLVLSSYNRFNNKTLTDAFLIAIFNSLTSIFAGFVVFAILGFLAHQQETTVDKVVQSGITLAFVSYPTAVLEMDPAPMWSFFFFFMLINLALSSICSGMQTFIAFLLDEYPHLEKKRVPLVVGFSVIFYLCGLSMITGGGIHLFTIFDTRCTSSLIFLTLIEIVVVAYAYKLDNFFYMLNTMEMTLSKPIEWMWKILLYAVTPLILAFITITSWIDHEPMSYNGYVYPSGIQALGWIMELLPLILFITIPLHTVYSTKKKSGLEGKELLNALFTTKESWHQGAIKFKAGKVKNDIVEEIVDSNDNTKVPA